MRPATGELWAVWGLPSENEYESFRFEGGSEEPRGRIEPDKE
jgi:hypothetical protein